MDLPRMWVWLIRRGRRIRDATVGEREVPAPHPVNGFDVLRKVSELPISEWSYTFEPDVRHVGPMAQDFHGAFGLGDSDRRIHQVDGDGVCLVAIQALHRLVTDLQAEVAQLRQRLGEPPGDETRPSC